MQRVAGINPDRIGSRGNEVSIGRKDREVALNVEFRHRAGGRAQYAMLGSPVLLNGTIVVELYPLDARAGAHLDPATRPVRSRAAQSRQQRLQQQRQHQQASQISAMDGVE